ncbi:hypothetical protein D3C84_627860 [compost metagenome]
MGRDCQVRVENTQVHPSAQVINQTQFELALTSSRKKERVEHAPGLCFVKKRSNIPECSLGDSAAQPGRIVMSADFPVPRRILTNR